MKWALLLSSLGFEDRRLRGCRTGCIREVLDLQSFFLNLLPPLAISFPREFVALSKMSGTQGTWLSGQFAKDTCYFSSSVTGQRVTGELGGVGTERRHVGRGPRGSASDR